MRLVQYDKRHVNEIEIEIENVNGETTKPNYRIPPLLLSPFSFLPRLKKNRKPPTEVTDSRVKIRRYFPDFDALCRVVDRARRREPDAGPPAVPRMRRCRLRLSQV